MLAGFNFFLLLGYDDLYWLQYPKVTERATARKVGCKEKQGGRGAFTVCVCASVSVCLYESSRCALTPCMWIRLTAEGISGAVSGGPSRVLRSGKKTAPQVLLTAKPYTPENVKEAVDAKVPGIFTIDDLDNSKDSFQAILAAHELRYRTTTGDMVTFNTVLQHQNGSIRIETGVHRPCEEGSVSGIVEMLCARGTRMRKAWETVKKYGVQQPVEVMMCSGDSRSILTPENNGGVAVSRTGQTVVCHYDDIHNFTFVLYGQKTFLLARPQDVAFGPEPDINVNRTVDTSSSIFRKAVIGPGQLLYLPKDWWHEVSSAYSDALSSC